MTKHSIVPATLDHARDMAPRMVPADAREAYAVGHFTPHEALRWSFMASAAPITWLCAGEPAAMFGICQVTALTMDAPGAIWLMGTDLVKRHPVFFFKGCQRFVELSLEHYHRLENYVDARHHRAIKLMTKLGFTVEPPTPFGMDQLPFHRFWIERRKCA